MRARTMELASMAILARWLGPWADATACPRRVSRRRLQVHGRRPFHGWLYTPARRRPRGAYLIAPGLHFEGPDDGRMDRFARILAAAGFVTLSPAIADFMDLRITARAIDDFGCALAALEAVPEVPTGVLPSVFSISFGSMLALRMAAMPGYADRVGSLVLFGGYADARDAMRFCLVGHGRGDDARENERADTDQTPGATPGAGGHDPLNRPVVFINLLDELLELVSLPPANAPILHAAWLDFVRATWSRQETERVTEYRDVALALARQVPDEARELFLMGCHAAPGGPALCERALARVAIPHTEVLGHLSRVRGPIHIVHGVDDDVIPVAHARQLAAAMPASVECGLYITGLYGHTANRGLSRLAPALAHEVANLMRLLHAMATPCRNDRGSYR